ncbi:hypothetical protein H4683_001064 [Filibacter limicola]|uniref:Uncharacterized protein n=1 Tax=Sporosarcina limicola TaxID=34101 RepID=A0A927MM25_9BACL|nr:hypothetical protein [Sporosarcina limicola]
MPNDTQARPPAGSVREFGRYPIDLIGPRSHTLVIQPGVGSLSIGPSQLGKKADLHVATDAIIDWTVFDAFATPAGSPWPRFLHYAGSDAGFFDWAQKRPIEEMTWAPILSEDTVADARQSNLQGLHIKLDQSERLSLKLPKGQLSQSDHLIGQPITEEMAQRWFDAVRDY